jgi:hypothetical protein
LKVTLLKSPLPRPEFVPFSIVIEIEEPGALRNLTRAAGTMTNGHGLQLYDLLKTKCDEFSLEDCDFGSDGRD